MILCSTNNRGQSRTVFVFSYFELWIAHKSSMPFMSFASVGVMDIYSYITDCVALIPLFTLLQYLLFATPWYNFVAISFFRKTFASHNLRWYHYLLHIVKQTALWCSETFNSFRSSHTAQPVCLILAGEKCSIFSGEKKNWTSSLYLAWMLLFDVWRKLRFGFVRFDTFVGDE